MTDNELIERLFQDARQTAIPDNGFSARVMERVNAEAVVQQAASQRERLFSRLWTTVCVAVAIILFVALDGWDIIVYRLLMLLNTPPSSQQLLALAASAGVVMLLAVSDVVRRERYSLI